jgi:hypothetical protein
MDSIAGCLACDLAAGRRVLPGRRIHETATTEAIESVGDYGAALQARMFERAQLPPADAVELFAERARELLRVSQPATRGTT